MTTLKEIIEYIKTADTPDLNEIDEALDKRWDILDEDSEGDED